MPKKEPIGVNSLQECEFSGITAPDKGIVLTRGIGLHTPTK